LYFSENTGSEIKYRKLANELREEIETMVETKTEFEIIDDNNSDSEEEFKMSKKRVESDLVKIINSVMNKMKL
jgi:hypothetical protein